MTVDEIIERFKKERLPRLKKRTQGDYGRHFVLLSRDFGQRQAKDLTLKELQGWMNVETGKIQRNRQMAALSSLLGAAVKWGWLDSNVCKEVERNKSKARERIVTDKEFAQMKTYAGRRMPMAMDLSLLAGLKQGAILELTWTQIDRQDNVIRIRHHLTGRQIQIPITPEIDAVLAKCKELPAKKKNLYVIPNRQGDAYTSEGFRAMWQRAVKRYLKTGNDHFTFEDIRQTWAHRQTLEKLTPTARRGGAGFVDQARIEELRALQGKKPNPTRLTRLCEEINACYKNNSLLAVALLARTVINHVPPVFGFNTFSEVANNYGGDPKTNKSFKQIARRLEEAARSIGDKIAHETMRPVESLPSAAQVDFSPEFDVLLEEVARLLRERTSP